MIVHILQETLKDHAIHLRQSKVLLPSRVSDLVAPALLRGDLDLATS